MRSGFPITRVEALGQAAVDERPRLPLEVETRAPGIRHGALALTLLAIGLGIYLRWVDLSSLFLIGDEEWNLQRARLSAGEILTGYDLMGSGIAVPFLQHLALQVFGEDLWALRIPGWLAGIAGLIATAAVGAPSSARPRWPR